MISCKFNPFDYIPNQTCLCTTRHSYNRKNDKSKSPALHFPCNRWTVNRPMISRENTSYWRRLRDHLVLYVCVCVCVCVLQLLPYLVNVCTKCEITVGHTECAPKFSCIVNRQVCSADDSSLQFFCHYKVLGDVV